MPDDEQIPLSKLMDIACQPPVVVQTVESCGDFLTTSLASLNYEEPNLCFTADTDDVDLNDCANVVHAAKTDAVSPNSPIASTFELSNNAEIMQSSTEKQVSLWPCQAF